MEVAFINENHILQLGSYRVDDTFSMVMAIPVISDSNAGHIH